VNFAEELLAQGRMHRAMPGDAIQAPKPVAFDGHAEMAFAPVPKPGMAAMRLAFIDDIQMPGREGGP